MNPCRTCKWAYLRTEKTYHYNYEACALGVVTMMPYLEREGGCKHYERASDGQIGKVRERRSAVIWGEPLDL